MTTNTKEATITMITILGNHDHEGSTNNNNNDGASDHKHVKNKISNKTITLGDHNYKGSKSNSSNDGAK